MALIQDTPRWMYVLTAMDGSIPSGAGEIYWPNQRTYSDPLGGVRQASCTIPLDHPRADWVVNNDALLKVYRRNRFGNWNHMMTGDVVQTEEQGTGNISQLIVTGADPFWRLLRRLIGMETNSSTGQAIGWKFGTPTLPQDLTTMIALILYYTNQIFPTGIQLGTIGNSHTTSAVGPVYSSFAGSIIQQIATILGGPDFWVEPVEPSGSMPGTLVGYMNIAPMRGELRRNAIFDYGFGKHNVVTYNRILNKQNVCNHAVALPQGWPTSVGTGDTQAVIDDTPSQNRIGRFDDIVSTDVSSFNLRVLLAQESVQVRKGFQQQITFQPTVDSDLEYATDYNTGDVVVARAYDAQSQSFRYNGTIRLYGVSIQIDDQDAETTQLTLIPDQQSSSFSVSGGI